MTKSEHYWKLKAWEMFCVAHPVEAHEYDPEGFWTYFHRVHPTISRDKMVQVLKECEV